MYLLKSRDMWAGFSWLGVGYEVGVVEYGNEHTSFIIVGNFLANRESIRFLKNF